ncbi:protein DYAD [Pyrus ussuriensis x Pyrus communis]|uniref:Protein DYAD n=1 Tax=Pyrus ussuriensis x Pyrus communis TaxID=2448454 RepID=A0A5N5HP05_9ROSA|nr:protein DYAD [Pyrus ussuriensis x Pyrus communis]
MQYCSIGGVEIEALNTKKSKQANQKRIQRNRSTTKYKEIQQNQERLKDLAKWKAQSEQSLKDNFDELMTWKDKVEQQRLHKNRSKLERRRRAKDATRKRMRMKVAKGRCRGEEVHSG